MEKRERDVEAWLRGQIEKMGGLFLKFTSPGNDGVPDRIAVLPRNRTVFVELKAGHGKLSRIQEHQIRRLLDLDQQVCVVYGMAGAWAFVRDMKGHMVSSMSYWGDGDEDEAFLDEVIP